MKSSSIYVAIENIFFLSASMDGWCQLYSVVSAGFSGRGLVWHPIISTLCLWGEILNKSKALLISSGVWALEQS